MQLLVQIYGLELDISISLSFFKFLLLFFCQNVRNQVFNNSPKSVLR